MHQERLLPPQLPVRFGSEMNVDTMVDVLVRGNVAKKLDQLLPLFKQLRHDHFERGKNSLKTLLSTVGVTVSLSLGAINVPRSCFSSEGSNVKCAQSMASLASTFLFFGVTVWNFWELYRHHDRYQDFLKECDDMFDRTQQRKLGAVMVDDVFGWIDALSPDDLKIFKRKLERQMALPLAGVNAGLAGAPQGSGPSTDQSILVEDEDNLEEINDRFGDD